MAIEIDIALEAGDWPAEDELRGHAHRATGAVFAELDMADPASELSLLFTDDASIRRLNREWRGKDKATNVLSFPAFEVVPGDPLPPMLGDIILAFETVSAEAALEGKPFVHHLTHLIVHGLLHLLGHDHENDADADEMEGLESKVLARLAIPDPYV
jgi:probable rRNA maturation factor